MPEHLCTIIGEFLGLLTEPCGKAAAHTSTGRCDRGHSRSRVICSDHAAVFEAYPATLLCAECYDDGYESSITISTEPLGAAAGSGEPATGEDGCDAH